MDSNEVIFLLKNIKKARNLKNKMYLYPLK